MHLKKCLTTTVLLLSAGLLCGAGDSMSLIDFSGSDSLPRISASGQPDAAIQLKNGQLLFSMDNSQKNRWPGIMLKPQGKFWNLENYGYIDVNVTNPTQKEIPLCVRVDDDSKLIVSGAWVTGQKKIKPGSTDTIRVYLGDLNYGRGYILQRAKIHRILIFGGANDSVTPLIVNSIRAGGKNGDAPKYYQPLIVPEKDGMLVDFSNKNQKIALFPRNATSRQTKDGMSVSFRKGKQSGLLMGPQHAKWDLRFYNQVDFYLYNPSAQARNVICSVNSYLNLAGPRAEEKVVVPAQSKQKVTVSFMAREPWRSFVRSDKNAKISDAASERIRGVADKGGQDLVSDEVQSIAVSSGESEDVGEIVVEKVIASVSAPAVLPEWSGKRPPVPGDWKLTLNEEFDAPALNTALWNQKMPWVGLIPNELQRYNPKNSFVEDGMLHLRARREKGYLNGTNKYFPEGEYTSAVVTTYGKFSQAYGYFESRLKPQKAIGVWPAFWAMPFHGPEPEKRRLGTTRGGAEIDIFEHPTRFGPYRTNIAVHWDNYGPDHKKTGTSRVYYAPDAEGFITAGILWEPGKITWYVNQEVVGVWESPTVPTVPIYLKFTIQMGSWSGFIVEDEKLSQEDFLVDYVRVWQRSGR